MSDDLLNDAIQHPDTPERAHHFRTHWLPQVIGETSMAEYDGMADTYIADLHRDIYLHGPHHAKVAQHLTHLNTLLTPLNIDLYRDLQDLAITFTNFYNHHNDEFKNNPDFAYRECNMYEIDLEIPGYEDCMTNPNLIKWAMNNPTAADRRIDEGEMIDAYKISLTCWDALEHLESFQQTKNLILTLQHRWDFPAEVTP